ncbi:MAG: hypothetical protein ACPGUV_06835 [Polyangiales bacterium]
MVCALRQNSALAPNAAAKRTASEALTQVRPLTRAIDHLDVRVDVLSQGRLGETHA